MQRSVRRFGGCAGRLWVDIYPSISIAFPLDRLWNLSANTCMRYGMIIDLSPDDTNTRGLSARELHEATETLRGQGYKFLSTNRNCF
jgi:hypothetical protein